MIITYRFDIEKSRDRYRIIRTTLYNGTDPIDALGRSRPQTITVFSITTANENAEHLCKQELNRRQQMRR